MSKFQHLETFAFFVGYPRSGHSLVGACIDAHPNAVISHELDALGLLKNGMEANELFEKILEKSQAFHSAGSEWSGYKYHIPGMWQGRFETLRLIGDKKGGTTIKHLMERPDLLDKVKTLAPATRLIHVVRNPYDCITTAVIRRQKLQQRDFTPADLLRKADHFFKKAEAIQHLITEGKEAIHTLRNEDLIQFPAKKITDLCVFLDLPVTEEYLQACSSLIWPAPKPTRSKLALWRPGEIDYVKNQMNRFPFFEGYTF